jgi:hypothetical protein
LLALLANRVLRSETHPRPAHAFPPEPRPCRCIAGRRPDRLKSVAHLAGLVLVELLPSQAMAARSRASPRRRLSAAGLRSNPVRRRLWRTKRGTVPASSQGRSSLASSLFARLALHLSNRRRSQHPQGARELNMIFPLLIGSRRACPTGITVKSGKIPPNGACASFNPNRHPFAVANGRAINTVEWRIRRSAFSG